MVLEKTVLPSPLYPRPGENPEDVLDGLEPGDLDKLFEETENITTPPKEENPDG